MRLVDGGVHFVENVRISRYGVHRITKATIDLSTLVSSRYGFGLLLARHERSHRGRSMVLVDELRRTFHHVRLLRSQRLTYTSSAMGIDGNHDHAIESDDRGLLSGLLRVLRQDVPAGTYVPSNVGESVFLLRHLFHLFPTIFELLLQSLSRERFAKVQKSGCQASRRSYRARSR